MKMKMKLALVVGVATLAVTPAFAKGGKDSLHFAIRESMTDAGVEPGSAGTASATGTIQGNANNQRLDVTASGLTPDTDYDVVVNINGAGNTDLGTFTTDKRGRLAAHLSNRARGKTVQLPDEFDISQILELDVVNVGLSQTVLSVDTVAPGSLKYLARRNLNNGGTANGTLQVSSTKGRTKFLLSATGLDAGTDYTVVFNGAVVDTVTTDSHGRLKLTDEALPENILDLQTVEIRDGSDTAVLATATPLP
jgi:hypothetical protein